MEKNKKAWLGLQVVSTAADKEEGWLAKIDSVSQGTTYQLICLHPPFLRMRCPHPGHLLVLHQISSLETTLIYVG